MIIDEARCLTSEYIHIYSSENIGLVTCCLARVEIDPVFCCDSKCTINHGTSPKVTWGNGFAIGHDVTPTTQTQWYGKSSFKSMWNPICHKGQGWSHTVGLWTAICVVALLAKEKMHCPTALNLQTALCYCRMKFERWHLGSTQPMCNFEYFCVSIGWVLGWGSCACKLILYALIIADIFL